MALYVNDELINPETIQQEIENLRPEYERVIEMDDKQAREQQLAEWARENVIERVLLAQSAREKYKTIPANEVEKAFSEMAEQCGGEKNLLQQIAQQAGTPQQVKEDLANGIRMERLFKEITAKVDVPDEEAITAYFKENIDRFTMPEMIRASHILKQPKPGQDPAKIKSEMERILKKLDQGGDFEKLAGQHSDCHDQGGDLGFFPRGHMVPAFEEVVFNMQPGEISNVFETEFGFHIAKVIQRRASGPCDISEVRDMIIEQLTEQNRQKAIEDYIDTKKSQAKIEVR